MDNKKKSFDVYITRIEYGSRTIRVYNVEDEEEASRKALDISGDYEYSCHDADYEVDGYKEVV